MELFPMRRLPTLLLAVILVIAPAALADVRDEIHNINESLLVGVPIHHMSERIVAAPIIPIFYQARDYQPAWDNADQAQEVLNLIEESFQEGLNPEDYHYSTLDRIFRSFQKEGKLSDRRRARFDVLLTDGLLLYFSHLVQGKVDPGTMESTWNYSRREFDPEEVTARLSAAIKENGIRAAVEDVKPDLRFYNEMKNSLVRYRRIADKHEFEPLTDTATLRPGDDHPGVSGLRRRLFELEFTEDGSTSAVYDEALEEVVRFYQRMHGLDDDGIVGRMSWEALNVPYHKRVEQLRINLDRLRWVREDLSDDYVVVNIAGFELYHLRNQQLNWKTSVMTGTVKHATPMFHSRISYLVLNPTWTVPRSIIRRSLFPKFSADPNYVIEKNYHLYDGNGNRADPLQLDWSQYSRGKFPFRVVQQPGPGNALGVVKFMFPNKYAIYLHDTPNRELFSRTARAFSSGCIRVQDPLELARILLNDESKWGMESLEAKVEGGVLENVRLPRKVDVMLMYWTTGPTGDVTERVSFFPDVYNKDPAVMQALNQPPVWVDG